MYEHLNFFPGLYPRAQIQQGRERERRKAGVVRRREEGKEKVEGMTEERGRNEGIGNSDGGIAPLLLGGIDATGCVPLPSRLRSGGALPAAYAFSALFEYHRIALYIGEMKMQYFCLIW